MRLRRKKDSHYQSSLKVFSEQFKKNKLGKAALWVILFLAGVGLFAPFIANDAPWIMASEGKLYFPGLGDNPKFMATDWSEPDFEVGFAIYPLVKFSPIKSNLRARFEKPSWAHPFGTDDLGMDVFARIVWGTRISISIGIVSTVLVLLIGGLMGMLSGYFGGWVDVVISRFIEIMMCFPTFFLILAVLAFLPPSIYNIMIVLGLTGWTGIARLVRGEVLRVKNLDFVKNAKVSGVKTRRILMEHILPNSITPALVSATFNVASAILVESSLSFLGFGVQPPTASWGSIIQVANTYVLTPSGRWLTVYPAVAIFLTVTAYNLLGEAVRDAADPRLIR